MLKLKLQLAAVVMALVSGAAKADYPERPITIVVPFAAGGTADLLPRIVAEKLRPVLGQAIIIENRPGAGGNLGASIVANAKPDGYTLLCAPQLNYSAADLIYKSLNFDPLKLEPVVVLARYPNVIVARRDFGPNNLAELIDYAKKSPGKLTYASQGIGQVGHLTFALLAKVTGTELVHVPYRGSAPAITDLLSGQVDLLADNLLPTASNIDVGNLKLIAVGGTRRVVAYPNVAGISETIPGFISDTWMAISAPQGTPPEIVSKLSKLITEATRSPEFLEKTKSLQTEPLEGTPAEMGQLIKGSRDQWAPIIKEQSIQLE
ncbi:MULTISPECIES: tripartite tricarboxylate transporter substrate binding protein [unclassified Beijerinckia]|uniref:Bug family tripartite tricarboxylate transporter substrate binding protein n=1 Tax=unclassified Beijerinckia TaxID=2638183 RepID=UPI00089B317C|nr:MULTISPECIES: tripartite tricarboxylate transporter substrate binding protein [unclassified Beijerinckia]MDH7794579.1 tripartite-type tricarboxylate transporter receptor subunit TctC [Beijerinckia sp. GAS462]SEB67295.1 Tripartite-type tricarboxylate transporter, receptor component TctC [Beijerinckia sp. 28-YEA-48]